MTDIPHNLQHVQQRITTAARQYGRAPKAITLLAVSKTQPVSAIETAWQAGQRAFGENYVQEAIEKIAQFHERHPHAEPEWHFIGPLQANKSRLVSEHFHWCHSVDRLRIARRLSEQRPAELSPLNVLLQVNISEEPSKSGVTLAELPALAAAVAELPRLRLRGLMAIPAPTPTTAQQRQAFRLLSEAFQTLKPALPDFDTLSMGMSDDLEAAIAEGSTLVRIGTAIFGARPPR